MCVFFYSSRQIVKYFSQSVVLSLYILITLIIYQITFLISLSYICNFFLTPTKKRKSDSSISSVERHQKKTNDLSSIFFVCLFICFCFFWSWKKMGDVAARHLSPVVCLVPHNRLFFSLSALPYILSSYSFIIYFAYPPSLVLLLLH